MREQMTDETDALKLLKGKLGAARIVLEGVEGDQRAPLSRCQADAVLEALGRVGKGLNGEERASLQAFCLNVKFDATDAQAVLQAIAGDCKRMQVRKKPGLSQPHQLFGR